MYFHHSPKVREYARGDVNRYALRSGRDGPGREGQTGGALGKHFKLDGDLRTLTQGDDLLKQLRTALSSKSARILDLFRDFDADGSGTIEKREFHTLLVRMGIRTDAALISELFDSIELDGNGVIEYNELRAALRVHPTGARPSRSLETTLTFSEGENRRVQTEYGGGFDFGRIATTRRMDRNPPWNGLRQVPATRKKHLQLERHDLAAAAKVRILARHALEDEEEHDRRQTHLEMRSQALGRLNARHSARADHMTTCGQSSPPPRAHGISRSEGQLRLPPIFTR